MAQRVDFAFFPGVREENLLATLNKVYGHIRRTPMAHREFRDWLKDEALWNKEEMPQLMALCDILTDGTVRLGPWAERFFAASNEEQMRDAIYKRLCDENLLLVKYALEALDTEGGGRLHSIHELHRLLTSYVYPGKHVTLEPFKNWVKWAVVSGRIKMIGIRWGLTDAGKAAVPRLRTIDPDEFLEDENSDATAQMPTPVPAPVAPAPAPAPAVAAPSAPAPAAKPAAAAPKPAPKKDDDPDEDLDLPPEAEPVDDAIFSRYEQQFEAAPVAEAAPPAKAAKPAKPAAAAPATAKAPAPSAQPVPAEAAVETRAEFAAARPTATPHVLVRYAHVEHACRAEPPDAGSVVAALRDHGRAAGLGGGSLLLAYGIESRMAANEPARHLFLASLLARLHCTGHGAALADALLERTGGTLGPLALLLDRPEALVDGLGRWQLAGHDGIAAQLRAALTDAALGGRAIKAQPELPVQLGEAASSDALIALLGQTVLRGAPPVASFWLVREMVRAGAWTRPAATEIAFVPWRSVRLMAYRLRLIDNHFGHGPNWVAVAKRLCTLFPPSSVEAAALEALAPADHLRFDCAKAVICQQPCGLASADP